jgi:hypothetical protein
MDCLQLLIDQHSDAKKLKPSDQEFQPKVKVLQENEVRGEGAALSPGQVREARD